MINVLLLAGIIGGITGIVMHLLRNDKILLFPKMRKRPKGVYLGFIADFLCSFLAAVFAVTYFETNIYLKCVTSSRKIFNLCIK